MKKRILPRPRAWTPPPDMHLHTPCTWACWTCRTTAKARPPHRPLCPQCRQPMRNMGTRWRPGRGGKWRTQAEIEALGR